MKIALLIAIIAILNACANQKTTYLADGSQGHSIDCSGTARNWGMCYEKAGELCGTKGYDILNKEGEEDRAGAGAGGVFAVGHVNRNLLVRCKP